MQQRGAPGAAHRWITPSAAMRLRRLLRLNMGSRHDLPVREVRVLDVVAASTWGDSSWRRARQALRYGSAGGLQVRVSDTVR
jgi:hypothetical protein